MEETIVIPSPNWFHVSILRASRDGWLVYGGPAKSLCFLEPVDCIGMIDSKQRFKAHLFHKAHKEKISSVDISPQWPDKRNVLSGGYDGVVKEWSIEVKDRSWTINYLHCHEEHSIQKEEVAGVCYGTPTFAVSVGSGGQICKWDLNTNVVKGYSTHLKSFKPTCISCSPHKQLHVAVGTRQGVVFVIDISGIAGKLIYRIRGQDDEINQVSWCPQYSVTVNKRLGKDKLKKKNFTASDRMDRIRNDLEPSEALEAAIAERSLTKEKSHCSQEEEEVIIPEDSMFDVYKDHEDNEFGHKKFEPENIIVKIKAKPKDDFLAECEKLKATILKNKNEPEESIESLVKALDKAHVDETLPGSKDKSTRDSQEFPQHTQRVLQDTQGLSQDIQELSQDTQGLSQDIQELSQDTQGLSQDTQGLSQDTQGLSQDTQEESQDTQDNNEYGHLLATIGKYGGVRIWTQTGKLLSSCTVLFNVKREQKDNKNRGVNWPTLHWFKPDSLLIADGKSQLLEANPLKIDSKSKLDWRIVNSLHRRGLYFVSSSAPRVQTPELLASTAADNWVVWTIGQDRNVISYNMKEDKKIEVFNSCGGFLYHITSCPYDAGKIATSAGDGSIRIWETSTTNELEDQLSSGVMTSYWQNVQGKILKLAWHPTKENLLAFATAESRVGLLDVSGTHEKPAKNFPNSFKQGVYSLSWGEGMDLYACGNGELAVFRANKLDERGQPIPVEIEGQQWEVSEVHWTPQGIVVGGNNGGVALLDNTDYRVIAVAFVFLKMIYTIEWHPRQTTSSEEESLYKNFIAVCSNDKTYAVAILEYEDKGDGAKQLKQVREPLKGHEGPVLHVSWNPHRDAQLLSTSQDATVRIWNVAEGECIAIFGGHTISVHSGMWCTRPRLANKVISCGGDSCLRAWDITDYPVDTFAGVRNQKAPQKKKKRARDERKRQKRKSSIAEEGDPQNDDAESTNADTVPETDLQPTASENVATSIEYKMKGSRIFLLPIIAKQINKISMSSVRQILTKYIEVHNGFDIPHVIKTFAPNDKGLGFLKMFGTLNDLNELLDQEAANHLERNELESYFMLLFYRGRVDEMIKYAAENDMLDHYLMSLSPSVSFKYWKDTTQLYVAQLERMAAKNREDKAGVYRFYGGIIFRKATALLSIHNLKGCVDVLVESSLFKEAYVLCRLRHMDSIAEEVLQKWAQVASISGSLMISTILHLARGDISEASIILGRSNQTHYLKLAAQLAKLAGHNTFATSIEARVQNQLVHETEEKEDELEDLPSRIEALLNANDSGTESEEHEEIFVEKVKAVNGNCLGDLTAVENITDPTGTPNGNVAATNGKVLVGNATKDEVNDLKESKE